MRDRDGRISSFPSRFKMNFLFRISLTGSYTQGKLIPLTDEPKNKPSVSEHGPIGKTKGRSPLQSSHFANEVINLLLTNSFADRFALLHRRQQDAFRANFVSHRGLSKAKSKVCQHRIMVVRFQRDSVHFQCYSRFAAALYASGFFCALSIDVFLSAGS